ncbi:hypothetical protein [Kitasatospora indigofera]|uniref:hypothetical protein n=1 Tax=Kitasatospora indigofera TaxID=67307 RepID=UPI00339F1E9A
MDHSALARRLDGRNTEVTVKSFHRGAELAQQNWAAGLYGYRLERHDPGVIPGLAGPRLHFALDPDPAAQGQAGCEEAIFRSGGRPPSAHSCRPRQ